MLQILKSAVQARAQPEGSNTQQKKRDPRSISTVDRADGWAPSAEFTNKLETSSDVAHVDENQ
jgi:hypothetical protein